MSKPLNTSLQVYYTAASKTVRSLDKADGGVESEVDSLITAIFALEAGLIMELDGRHPIKKLEPSANSAFDALVMLHELKDRILARGFP